jgi:putative peptidoglycan lipid II flippase
MLYYKGLTLFHEEKCMFTQKTIVQKTALVSISTMASRLLGIVRETLLIRYLGATMVADAFLTAFKIPNTLRKAFAEGALSAAFVPALTSYMHINDKRAIGGLVAMTLLVFEFLVLLLCLGGIIYAKPIITCIAPGFDPEKIIIASTCLRIVMPFILFISMSALFAGVLQANGRFMIPALGPVLWNCFVIGTLIACIWFSFPVTILCWGILMGGIAQFILHVYAYIQAGFGLGSITKQNVHTVSLIIVRFLLCLPSISLMEFSSFIDTSFASYLKTGSISLLYLANRFVGIPLGVFAVAFATVLLPHFSRVMHRTPQRISFYILESAKCVFWVSLPSIVLMWFFAKPIFTTLFLYGNKFTIMQATEAATILRALLLGLFFFSFNKIILNVYYAMHVTWVPALIAACTALLNIVLNWVFIGHFQAAGLALATTCSSAVQTTVLLYILHHLYKRPIYTTPFLQFIVCYGIHVILFFIPFWLIYMATFHAITSTCTETICWFFIHSIGYWVWVGPLCCLYAGALWYTRRFFYDRIYFLN